MNLIGSEDGSVPKLGPRTWWVYLALGEPKTALQLSAEAGIVEASVRKHLRRLERAALVTRSEEPGAETIYRRIRELDRPTVYALVGRVDRARLVTPEGERLPEYAGLPPGRAPLLVGAAVLLLLVAGALVVLLV
ncbi:DNA-binding transcriptional ArsR family regulator [Nocardioides thalensis]|uniref:DNA-binding transcriptional ArsR family regulator n=1 Tax=Nocardioides thalensis TaxID=1914755 RepID=A0A853C7M6_9ACTN|nr:helix-turn-helix domain-containing protein [Nocardioides thalensis]NYJ03016.1 DNA-binding transcriptional ArsR family regulator [Nocardioides thalensis]